MANLRIKGDTSGYVDLVSPDVAGSQVINLDRLVETNANGQITVSTDTEHQLNVQSATSGAGGSIKVSSTGAYAYNVVQNNSREWRFGSLGGSNFTISDWSAGPTERLVIKSNGNVGIGTTDPLTKLMIAGSDSTTHSTTGDTRYTNARMTIQNTDNTLFSVAGITLSSGSSVGGNWQMDSIRQNNYQADLAFKTRTGGSSFNETMRINAAGQVTTPNQPGFAAVRVSTYNYSGGTGYTTINDWSNSTTRSSFNIGSHFNNTTGVFTAPVSGKYTFKFQILLQSVASGDDSIHVAFYVNGSITQYGNIRAPGTSASYVGYGAYLPVIGSTDVYLSANDVVDLRMSSSGNIDVYGGSDWSRFSGYLIG